ncbi:MAG TPA: DUF2889 domain-containing protein [Terriglobales bacterium]|nr:DUF2889 domain-containing protein [Terriglobales bacterium]
MNTLYPTSLPQPVAREKLHERRYVFDGFLRDDGLFDIEGRMTDIKTYDFPNDYRETIVAGDALHDMRIRLTLDREFNIHDIAVVTAASPYAICPAITPAFQSLKGANVGPGWTRILRQNFSGTHGCTHHMEMLRAMGTVAFQTIYGQREKEKRERGDSSSDGPPADDGATSSGTRRRPGFIDTCYALDAGGDIVKQNWPEFYVAPDQVRSPDKASGRN